MEEAGIVGVVIFFWGWCPCFLSEYMGKIVCYVLSALLHEAVDICMSVCLEDVKLFASWGNMHTS